MDIGLLLFFGKVTYYKIFILEEFKNEKHQAFGSFDGYRYARRRIRSLRT
jgi:hypothetical protein